MKKRKAPNQAGTITKQGYVYRMVNYVRKMEHVRIAELALGKPMPKGAVVHHVNFDKSDNRPENLVVCPNQAYHQLLHIRTRAYEATGDANKRSCVFCKKYDDQSLLSYIRGKANGGYTHQKCRSEYMAKYQESR